MTFDSLLKRINRYIEAAKQKGTLLKELPYVCKTYVRPDGFPDDFIVKQIEKGALPLYDLPGCEQHNQEVERLWRGGPIQPKLYLNFDPSAEEGADLDTDAKTVVEETQSLEIEFQEWLQGLPPPVNTD